VRRCPPAIAEAAADDSQSCTGDQVQAAFDDDTADFRVILADPPWTFRSNSLAAPGRNPRRHYACLTVDQLCQLPLAERVARNAALFLCVPGPLLVIGAHLPMIKAWGFRPTAMGFVLIKLRPLADPTNFPWPIFTSAPASPPGKTSLA